MKRSRLHWSTAFAAWIALSMLTLSLPARAAEEPSKTEQAKESIEEAGRASMESVETLGKRIEANRLKNRSRDEIISWVLMGVLVGSIAGAATRLNCSLLGKVGKIALGLAGAFLGGMVVRVAEINYGWGAMQASYEELLFSLAGAILLLLAGRYIKYLSKRKASKP